MEYLMIAVAGLTVIVLATVFSRRTGVATPLLLVALGIGASYLPGVPVIEVEPEVVLAGVLPALLFSSAVQLPVIDFRRNLGMISWLSFVVVLASALAIGAVVHALFPGIPLAVGVALGAVVSPTDAVAATSIGHRLGLPPRLMTVLEGESLVNDATALVLLGSAVAAVAGAFTIQQAGLQFGQAVLVAVLVGGVVGVLTARLRARLNDPVINSTVSFIVPYLAYFPSEELHGSGVLAVVVAGLVTGYIGHRRFSARDRQTQTTNWATVSFLLESGLFVLMGLQLPGLVDAARDSSSISDVVLLTAATVALLIVLRVIGVGIPLLRGRIRPGKAARTRERLAQIDERLNEANPTSEQAQKRIDGIRRQLMRGKADADFLEAEPITRQGGLVLAWSGMRGAVTVAAAQTIPEGLPHRPTLVLVAFLVAVVTLFGFGGTLPWVIRKAAFEDRPIEDRHAELTDLMQELLETVTTRLGPLSEQRVDGEPVEPEVADVVSQRFAPLLVTRPDQQPPPQPGLREQVVVIQRRYLDALREALNEERSIGVYRTATFDSAQEILDRQERALDRFS